MNKIIRFLPFILILVAQTLGAMDSQQVQNDPRRALTLATLQRAQQRRAAQLARSSAKKVVSAPVPAKRSIMRAQRRVPVAPTVNSAPVKSALPLVPVAVSAQVKSAPAALAQVAKSPVVSVDEKQNLNEKIYSAQNLNIKKIDEKDGDQLSPAVRKELPLLAYLKSVQQTDGVICGTLALLNARALVNLVEHGVKAHGITPALIQKELLQIAITWDPHQLLYTEQIEQYAHDLNLKHCMVLISQEGQIVCTNNNVINPEFEIGYDVHLFALQEKLSKADTELVVPFICNTGGHWILIALVKSINEDPRIIVMNSSNGPLTQDSNTMAFVRHIYALFGNLKVVGNAQAEQLANDVELARALSLSLQVK